MKDNAINLSASKLSSSQIFGYHGHSFQGHGLQGRKSSRSVSPVFYGKSSKAKDEIEALKKTHPAINLREYNEQTSLHGPKYVTEIGAHFVEK